MTSKYQVLLSRLRGREYKWVRECRTNGVLEMFATALRAINSRPPKDMYAYFLQFIWEKKHAKFPIAIEQEFVRQFGSRVDLYQACGIIMVVCHDVPRHFVPVKELRRVEPVGRRVNNQLVTNTIAGAFVPAGSLFNAGLRIELPSMGRSVPKGLIRRQPRT